MHLSVAMGHRPIFKLLVDVLKEAFGKAERALEWAPDFDWPLVQGCSRSSWRAESSSEPPPHERASQRLGELVADGGLPEAERAIEPVSILALKTRAEREEPTLAFTGPSLRFRHQGPATAGPPVCRVDDDRGDLRRAWRVQGGALLDVEPAHEGAVRPGRDEQALA